MSAHTGLPGASRVRTKTRVTATRIVGTNASNRRTTYVHMSRFRAGREPALTGYGTPRPVDRDRVRIALAIQPHVVQGEVAEGEIPLGIHHVVPPGDQPVDVPEIDGRHLL